MMTNESAVGKFWKPALAVGGVAAIGAFVFYSLNNKWLDLDIFSQLTPQHTFYIMLVFLILIFLIAAGMVLAWFLDRSEKNDVPTNNTVTFTVPESWNFQQTAIALAEESNSVLIFQGMSDEVLLTRLRSQTITANSTVRAIELLGALGEKQIPSFKVNQQDGQLIVKAI